MTDPIADMLTRIRNAVAAKHTRVDMPASRLKADIARILQDEGYIQGFKLLEEAAAKSAAPRTLRLFLKYGPHGEKLMPHKHPEDRVYTVISGVFYIGLGDEFDASKLEAYPPGAVIILPGNTPHFHWAKSGEYVTQITAMGPLGLEYLSAKDDPRNSNA